MSVYPSFRKQCWGKSSRLVRQEHLRVFLNLCLLSAITLLSSGNVTSLCVIVSSGTRLLLTLDLQVVSAQRRFLISLIENRGYVWRLAVCGKCAYSGWLIKDSGQWLELLVFCLFEHSQAKVVLAC